MQKAVVVCRTTIIDGLELKAPLACFVGRNAEDRADEWIASQIMEFGGEYCTQIVELR